jgi:hypothetical protein
MNELSAEDRKRVRRDIWLAAILLAAGLATIGLSLAELRAQNHAQVAQATGTPGQPLQATPSPNASPTNAPAESKPGGTRPTTPAPEPARPDAEAQKQGAKPALPPAPAEKMAPPIETKK